MSQILEEICDSIIEHDVDSLITYLDEHPETINARNKIGWTPLHHAIDLDFVEIADILLNSFYAEVNLKTNDGNEWTPLHIASFWGHEDIVDLLLQQENININIFDSKHRTPLHVAAESGHSDIISKLLSKGAKSNLLNLTREKPFDLAIKSGHSGCAKMLRVSEGTDYIREQIRSQRSMMQQHKMEAKILSQQSQQWQRMLKTQV